VINELTRCRQRSEKLRGFLLLSEQDRDERDEGVSRGERRRSFEVWELLAVLEANEGNCTYCSRPSQTMDHVIPFARGGLDDLANLVPACISCNQQKSDRTPPVWWMSASLPHFYDSRWRATPQGDDKTRSLRNRYLEIHEEVLGILEVLDDVAAEIADPVRARWFRKSFATVENRWGLASTPRERAALCRRIYADEIAAARDAGWPELKRSRYRLVSWSGFAE